jgi:hypothetical protein
MAVQTVVQMVVQTVVHSAVQSVLHLAVPMVVLMVAQMVAQMVVPMAALMAAWKVLLTDIRRDRRLVGWTAVQLGALKVDKMAGHLDHSKEQCWVGLMAHLLAGP